jgi:hypothetical protein
MLMLNKPTQSLFVAFILFASASETSGIEMKSDTGIFLSKVLEVAEPASFRPMPTVLCGTPW